jgi:outer membrane lipoprotein SlyB
MYSNLLENPMYRKISYLILALIVIATTGCASRLSGESYTRDEARTPQKVQFATVVHLRDVVIEGTKTPIGAAAGSVVGGIAGSTVGEGKGSAVGSVIGSVVGGVAGAIIEEDATKRQGIEITVKLDNGDTIAIVQETVENEKFAVGDKVRILTVRGNTRVAH